MNLLLLDPGELDDGGRCVLVGRRARHVIEVLKVTPGARVRAGIVRGGKGEAVIEAVEEGRVCVQLGELGPTPAPPSVSLILAMPRPKVVSRALQIAASMGVARIDLVNAWRVDKTYFHARRATPDALAADLRLGCEQGATTWVPDLAVHPLLMPFLRESLPARLGADAVALLAHPREAVAIETAVPSGSAAVVLAIGPEGGWIEREVASFRERGFTPVSLDAHVLRVEAAIAAALAQLGLLSRL
ncbi:MAG TPA: RsmE family RNA methyltransferase [Kofleriaceae bacterium]|nr:RsmE family RNA methyltransferase [Kofleriaceae bacterium]